MTYKTKETKRKKKRVYVRMESDIYDHIGRATYQLDLSISDIVRRAVKLYLKRHGVK